MRPFSVFVALCLTTFATAAAAASLQVAPVLIEVPAPGAATSITVRNGGARPIMAQMRVFRWTQTNGEERLEPTSDVVASPPTVELRPAQDYTVRVVRAAGGPTAGEDSYRLVVDELPEAEPRPGTVALVVRHVLPLFFSAPGAAQAQPVMTVSQSGRGLTLTAVNQGDRRIRFAAVNIRDASGRTTPVTKGLLGYALSRSTMRWTVRVPASLRPGAKVTVVGMTETGPFNATTTVQAAP